MGFSINLVAPHDLEGYLCSVCKPGKSEVWRTACQTRHEEERIRSSLGQAALSVEHIGSTSVPGLAAKPIVDILLVVEDSADEASYVPALEEAGYVLRVREPDFDEHRMFRTPDKDVHVHVFSAGSPEIERYLLLRERLCEHEGDRELYARTKRELQTLLCKPSRTLQISRFRGHNRTG